jgi:para-aminobenzoate synthetase component 2
VILIDNYDSFVYNLVQGIAVLGFPCEVVRNDQTTLEAIEAHAPSHIVISPGPCTPTEAGISCAVIERFAGRIPILGVCLGHQCLGAVFGGKVVRAEPVHGETSEIEHAGQGVFQGLPTPLRAARYHSLVVERSSLPDCLEPTASTDGGLIMGLRHRSLPGVEGVQFHPESYMSPDGPAMLATFLGYKRAEVS